MATKVHRNYELVVSDTFVVEPVTTKQLKVGELAFIAGDSGYTGELVLRVYDSLVSLTVPSHTWQSPGEMSLPVRRLRKGEAVVLTGTGE